jgi:glucuronoarabinoxylan endo-1,4-beta-xylanase
MKKKENKINIQMLLILNLLVLISISWKAQSQDIIQINKQTTRQTIWGFGGAANHPIQDLRTKFTEDNQKIILDKLFSTDNNNAGLSIIRLEVNPFRRTDNDMTKREQFTIEPEDGVWDWDADQYQRWFSQEAVNRSKTIHFLACPWSPPAWMKTNGSAQNGGNLKVECYDKYADYLKNYVDHYRNVFGFDIRWVSVQNEPSNSTGYASCTYDNNSLSIVTEKVADAIHSLNQGVKVGSPEGATREISNGFLVGMNTSTISKLDFIITHDYTGASNILDEYGKPVLNTEVWSEENSKADYSINDGIRWANAIKDALSRNEPGWLFWWLLEPTNKNTDEALIILKDDGTYIIPKRLYAIGQFSRFMREGDIRVDATSTNGQLGVIAAKDALGNASIAIINESEKAITTTIKGLSNRVLRVYRTSAGEDLLNLQDINIIANSANVVFAPRSITTLVEFQ